MKKEAKLSFIKVILKNPNNYYIDVSYNGQVPQDVINETTKDAENFLYNLASNVESLESCINDVDWEYFDYLEDNPVEYLCSEILRFNINVKNYRITLKFNFTFWGYRKYYKGFV